MWNLYKMLIAIILWLLKIRRHIPINSGILCMHTDKRGQTMKNDNDMMKFKKHNIVWSVQKRYSICSIHIYQIYIYEYMKYIWNFEMGETVYSSKPVLFWWVEIHLILNEHWLKLVAEIIHIYTVLPKQMC